MKWITTETGLKYVDLVEGDGEEIVAGNVVNMHYTLWLVGEDGKKGKRIQSSKDSNQPFKTSIPGRLIQAWNEGVPGMKQGGTRLLLSPPELAYGPRGMGGMIPPNATLFFEIECLEIIK
ncbi:MAG: FKBP-type peptidyl-prolyl cis-trans isomerase [bacterium]|nr:FKBP-type peptidyl-prolyl cis-trans isomerase [bacterium]